ncbi:hypothetical protein FHX82_002099 [Amycolatopsis bartoniae]|uniref:Sporulation protein SsgA n=1 Tax=Amycolatopsis bartoniae TaxID=941986 RepID=A0A8H9ME19_9PSEU|nr:SsgA family sporulation/cell division regulator [Amycolatopsis bartoniae]MBB2935079.1 hypothetical protein [Amycolatopsis bartoniae]TVT02555.1 SsgA family sporulation/cell division regulator [Amycolatopsis bartoniae]GHF74195.1 sporulation protein SsgA [Amycolatopsis bartoniae]
MSLHSLTLPLWAEWEDASSEVLELRPIRVKFRYRSDDPFAILLDFAVGSELWVRWTIARELLADGLVQDSGEGDVHIAPDSDLSSRVWLAFSTPTGVAVFAFQRSDLETALAETEVLVPIGSESALIDWDRELKHLRGDAA